MQTGWPVTGFTSATRHFADVADFSADWATVGTSGVVEVGSAFCARAAALSQAPMIVDNANVAMRPLLVILLNVILLASSNPRN